MFIIDDILGAITAVALAIQAVAVIGQILMTVAKALGLIEDDQQSVEDLGDKAIQAADEGIVPENYESYEQYLHDVENFELDPEKSVSIKQEEKIAKGAEVLLKAADEKLGTDGIVVVNLLNAMASNQDFFREFGGAVDKAIKENPELIKTISSFVADRKLSDGEVDAMTDKMVDIIKTAKPEMSTFEAENKAIELRKV